MASDTKQVVTGVVDGPVDAVFALLADPSRHSEIDGSGMCQGSSTGPVTEAGQAFIMNMAREGMGQYQTRNQVTDFEPGRRIAWQTSLEKASPEIEAFLGDIISGGQVWGFDLEGVGAGQTKVTHSCDWSNLLDERFGANCPFISTEEMSSTIATLGAAIGKAKG